MSVASAHIDDHLTLQGLNEPGRVLTRLGGAFAHTTAIAKWVHLVEWISNLEYMYIC